MASINYKIEFVKVQYQKAKGIYKNYQRLVDGDQLARDIDKTILEMEEKGYELLNMRFVTSTMFGSYGGVSYTDGTILTFQLIN